MPERGALRGLRGRTFQLAYAATLRGNLAGPYAATLRDLTRTLRGNPTLTRQPYAATLRGPYAATLRGAYAYCRGERAGVSGAARVALTLLSEWV